MLENVYTVSCKNKGVPFIRSAFLFAVFQFLTYIFQQKAPISRGFLLPLKEKGERKICEKHKKNNFLFSFLVIYITIIVKSD